MGAGLNGGAPSYKFEAGGASEENKDLSQPDSHKFKVGSNRGAGFSSISTNSGPQYEPSSGTQRRTPRRTLGVLPNENNGVKATETMGSASAISWPSQAGNNNDLGSTIGGA